MKKVISVMLCCIGIFSLIACTNMAEEKKEISTEYLTLDSLENVHDNVYISKDEKYSEMCQNVLREVERKELPGSLVIADDRQILFASGTDILQTDGETVSPYTTYQIGSVSKLFTSACILKLVEDEKLSLDDKMEKFFPEYENIKDVSVDNLLHMTSGIADFVNYPEKAFPELAEEFAEDVKDDSLDEEKMHEYMKTVALVFEPGTKTEYSNTNYYLLGSIVEIVTGKTFSEYVSEIIIEPLGLKGTKCGDIGSVLCAYDASMIMPRFDTSPPLVKGSGDITTNVLDLLQFDRALFTDDLLGEDAQNIMFNPEEDYSCGWMKDDASSSLHGGGNYWESSDEDTIYHQGRLPGFLATNIVLNPNGERLYVIFLMGIDENTAVSKNAAQRIGSVLKFVKPKEAEPEHIFIDAYREQNDNSECVGQIVKKLGDCGLIAIDSDNKYDMTNAAGMRQFLDSMEAGEHAEVLVYRVFYLGGLNLLKITTEEGKISVNQAYYTFQDNHLIQSVQSEFEADYCKYTEEGYLIIGGCWDSPEQLVLTMSEEEEHIALRIEPLDGQCREYCEKYMTPISYNLNNMFITDWNEDDFTDLDFYDIFEKFYMETYGKNCPYTMNNDLSVGNEYEIPADEFENVIMQHIKVSPKELHTLLRYDSGKNVYNYRPRGLEEHDYAEVPYPEVVAFEENDDGSMSLTVNAVYPNDNTSKLFSHKVTVMEENGKVYYLSNEMLGAEEPDLWWHSDRLSEDQWNEYYGAENLAG